MTPDDAAHGSENGFSRADDCGAAGKCGAAGAAKDGCAAAPSSKKTPTNMLRRAQGNPTPWAARLSAAREWRKRLDRWLQRTVNARVVSPAARTRKVCSENAPRKPGPTWSPERARLRRYHEAALLCSQTARCTAGQVGAEKKQWLKKASTAQDPALRCRIEMT